MRDCQPWIERNEEADCRGIGQSSEKFLPPVECKENGSGYGLKSVPNDALHENQGWQDRKDVPAPVKNPNWSTDAFAVFGESHLRVNMEGKPEVIFKAFRSRKKRFALFMANGDFTTGYATFWTMVGFSLLSPTLRESKTWFSNWRQLLWYPYTFKSTVYSNLVTIIDMVFLWILYERLR